MSLDGMDYQYLKDEKVKITLYLNNGLSFVGTVDWVYSGTIVFALEDKRISFIDKNSIIAMVKE